MAFERDQESFLHTLIKDHMVLFDIDRELDGEHTPLLVEGSLRFQERMPLERKKDLGPSARHSSTSMGSPRTITGSYWETW